MTLKTKYEALKELDKNRSNKEVVIQFNVSGSTLAAWKKKEKIHQAFQNSSVSKWEHLFILLYFIYYLFHTDHCYFTIT